MQLRGRMRQLAHAGAPVTPSRVVRFRVPAALAGARLDRVLAACVPDLSRTRARVLLDIGGVFVDGSRVKVAGRAMREGQAVEAHVGGALARATKDVGAAARARDAAAMPAFRVVLEDADLVVVDKPPGLLAAPTAESDRGNLADALARRGPAPAPIWVVHRIDLHTSGLLVYAKTPAANRALAAQLRVHDVRREYVAVVHGRFPDACVRADAPLGGKRAITHFAVDERFGDAATRLRCRLETGRTHQIRLHCQQLGHPVLGDPLHRTHPGLPPPRLALHAAVLGFIHPRTGLPVEVASPLPADLAEWLAALRADQRRFGL